MRVRLNLGDINVAAQGVVHGPKQPRRRKRTTWVAAKLQTANDPAGTVAGPQQASRPTAASHSGGSWQGEVFPLQNRTSNLWDRPHKESTYCLL